MVQQKNLNRIIGKIFFLSLIVISCKFKNEKDISKTSLPKKVATDSIFVINSKLSDNDKSFFLTDEEMGVGDDGIYNLQEPVFSSNVNTKSEYSIENITDWNLIKAFVFNSDSVINPVVSCEFNFLESPKRKDTLFQIENIFFYNGYRKSLKIWENNSRVKSMKIYVNDKLRGTINLYDTYTLQIIDIKKLGLFCYSGYRYKISLELNEFYRSDKYFNEVAISEIQFTGTRFQY